MEIKRFLTDDVREGMLSVRNVLGPEAVILSNRRVGNRIEILATKEFDAEAIDVRDQKRKRAKVEVSDFGISMTRRNQAEHRPELGARAQQTRSEPAEDISLDAPLSNEVRASAGAGEPDQGAKVPSDHSTKEGLTLTSLWRSAREEIKAKEADASEQEKAPVTGATGISATQTTLQSLEPEATEPEIEIRQTHLEETVRSASSKQSVVSPAGEALPSKEVESAESGQSFAVPRLSAADRLTGLGEELVELKSLLRKELTRLRSLQGRDTPVEVQCRELLTEMGLGHPAVERVMDVLTDAIDVEAASGAVNESTSRCQRVHAALLASIQVTDRDLIQSGGVFSVIGASGVGKTTTVAKLAARYALLHGRASVGLISTDAFKIGGQDQLATFGKLLGISVQTAHDEEQLTFALKQNMDKQLVLIDSAGMSERDVRMNQHLARIKMHGGYAKNLLIASATSQPGLADVVLSEYAHAPVFGTVLTKIDEAVNLGSGLSTLLQTAVPMAYSCDGQSLSDIQLASVAALLKEAFARVREARDIEFETHEVQQQHA